MIDEIGGNINQKGDRNMGGQLKSCEVGKTSQQKVSIDDKHFTVLGLTALSGVPVMCIVIFPGIRNNVLYNRY